MRIQFLVALILFCNSMQLTSSCKESNITFDNEIASNETTNDANESSTSPSHIPPSPSSHKRQGIIKSSIAHLMEKKKQSFNKSHKIIQAIGKRSKNGYKRSKQLILNVTTSLRSGSVAMLKFPHMFLQKLKDIKRRMTCWYLNRDDTTCSGGVFGLTCRQNDVEEATSCSNGKDCYQSSVFHDDCTPEQILKVETIFTRLTVKQPANTTSSTSNSHEDTTMGSTENGNEESSNTLADNAHQGGWILHEELVQRFLIAAGWKDTYHGMSIDEAVKHGVDLRKSHHLGKLLSAIPTTQNVTDIDTIDPDGTLRVPLSVIQHGASYCNRIDQYGRPIIYLKLGKLHTTEEHVYTNEDYIFSMLHTLERAEKRIQKNFQHPHDRKLSCQKLKHSPSSSTGPALDPATDPTNDRDKLHQQHLDKGKFIAIIDMSNVSIFSPRPSIRVVMDAVSLIKYAYPGRLASLYLVNAGYIFSAIWRLVEPTLSPASLGKIMFILSLEDARRLLPQELGKEGLESEYGGMVDTTEAGLEFNATEYFLLKEEFS